MGLSHQAREPDPFRSSIRVNPVARPRCLLHGILLHGCVAGAMRESKVYEGYGRLGKDWTNGRVFFGEAPAMFAFGRMIMRALGEKDSQKVHDLTTGVIQFDARSITGDFYLTEKCIRYRIEISVEAELVDDKVKS